MDCGIYKITNKVNGKSYIGQSVQIKERIKQHFRGHSQGYIGKALLRHGAENFDVSVVIYCEEHDLDYYEREFIKFYNTFGSGGYNLTCGGHNQHRVSEETGKKISKAMKAAWSDEHTRSKMLSKVQSEDVRERRIKSLKEFYSIQENIESRSRQMTDFIQNNPEYHQSLVMRLQNLRLDEDIESKRIRNTRKYWSDPQNKAKGVKALQDARTEEVENRRVNSLREFWASDASKKAREFHRDRMKKIYENPQTREIYLKNTKDALTQDVIDRRNESIRKRWDNISDEEREANRLQLLEASAKCRVPVRCNETGEVFESMSDASRWLMSIGKMKCDSSSKIGCCCRGERKIVGGYTWSYLDK